MDSQPTLTAFTIAGGVTTFVGAVLSQMFKASREVEGRIVKRLTPAGWLALGVSLVGMSGTIASELLRVSIREESERAGQIAEKQRKALLEQEARWRRDTSAMLALAKGDIEKNLNRTIAGFQASNFRFTEARTQLLASKQSLLADSVRRTNQIIIAGQPLMSLDVRWSFTSASPKLLGAIRADEAAERDNDESSQGGVPREPPAVLVGNRALTLLSFVARAGPPVERENDGVSTGPLVLLPLDDAHNAILYMGVPPDSEPAAGGRSGFSPDGLAVTRASVAGGTRYQMSWQLNSAILPQYVDRQNASVPSTSNMPRLLDIVLLSDFENSPVKADNFATPEVDSLWAHYSDSPVRLDHWFNGMTLDIGVNGFSDMTYRYRLTRGWRRVVYRDGEDVDGNCLVLEFVRG